VQAITVNPLPDAGGISGTDSVCPGSSVTLTDAVTGGSWSSSNSTLAIVSATGIVTGLASGAVSISYTVINICGTGTATYPFTVLSAALCPSELGALQLAGASLQLYPNPNDGQFKIGINSLYTEDALISITNVLGQKVNEFVMPVTAGTSNESAVRLVVAPGLYLVTALIHGDRFTARAVVE
jgi:hypothetical protein